ncbi:hypothetical protein HMPREF9244_01691 [Alloscardovia omnicolens F0580]|uniref:Colicin transporter n=1 Tax=Alloscardovia omnicolens F0580 TaxID=1321816 RepID=U1SCH9_9BIFI|nr:hypothetical protein [Alloscardovia omnicolens]ERH29628.1 hypothetical protein HMPREF9244_01691 [Alloscardovia omnicolens F0580]
MEESVDETLKIDEGTAERLDNTVTLEFSSVNQAKKRKRLWIIVSVVVVVVALVVAGVWGVLGVRSARIADCQKANKAYVAAYAAYEEAFKAATKTAQVISSVDQVADKAVFEKFHKATASKVSKGAVLDCDINLVNVFTTSTDTLVKKTSELNTAAKTITTVTKDLVASKDAKDLADAKTAAQAKLDEANNLYASSDGQVADNATRDTLKTQIDALDAAVKDKKTTVQALSERVQAVQSAIDQVNASVQAKKDADAAAAAAAAQAQAQAQAQSRSGSRSYSGGGNRSYGAPRSNSGNTSGATSGGSSSSGGDFDWRSALANMPPSPCEAEGTCHLAVG